jgi:hypothetical protein
MSCPAVPPQLVLRVVFGIGLKSTAHERSVPPPMVYEKSTVIFPPGGTVPGLTVTLDTVAVAKATLDNNRMPNRMDEIPANILFKRFTGGIDPARPKKAFNERA